MRSLNKDDVSKACHHLTSEVTRFKGADRCDYVSTWVCDNENAEEPIQSYTDACEQITWDRVSTSIDDYNTISIYIDNYLTATVSDCEKYPDEELVEDVLYGMGYNLIDTESEE